MLILCSEREREITKVAVVVPPPEAPLALLSWKQLELLITLIGYSHLSAVRFLVMITGRCGEPTRRIGAPPLFLRRVETPIDQTLKS